MANKSLGQYFTNAAVAKLLVSLIDHVPANSLAIDPMAGKGDLLTALKIRGVEEDRLFGIDIDQKALEILKHNLPNCFAWNGDCFSEDALGVYCAHDWDIVIANPPFVRREALAQLYGRNDASEHVRTLLLNVLARYGASEPCIKAARSYSSMADLSIPSLILCASLVKEGGTLAIVIPDALFTRKYARAFLELLRSEFCVEYLVRDESRTWFDDAQVKTDLLVAKRRSSGEKYLQVNLTDSIRGNTSLVEKCEFEGVLGDDAFQRIIHSGHDYSCEGLTTRVRNDAVLLENPEAFVAATSACKLLAQSPYTLFDWGVNAFQGLRSGANDFFYFHSDDAGTFTNSLLSTISERGLDEMACLRPALRYQADLSMLAVTDASVLDYRLLVIERPLGFGDADSDNDALLMRYVRHFEDAPIESKGRIKRIPEMSAIRSNGPTSDHESERYWYMLPQLRKRHLPDLALPRVVGEAPTAILLPRGNEIVVDANFITLVLDEVGKQNTLALFALFNSLPIAAQLESSCTVMGGGALKVESRDVKRLNLPIPDKMLIVELNKLGNEILKTPCYDYDTPVGVRLTKLVAAFYPAIDNVDWFAEQLLNDYLEHRISRRRQ